MFLLFLFGLHIPGTLFADGGYYVSGSYWSGQQQPVVTGRVTDINNQPLIGVTVFIKGTNIGTTTSGEGFYSLNVPDFHSVLHFSLLGYEEQSYPIEKGVTIDVVLRETSLEIEDVVVVGYGTQRKISSTASVASIDSAELLQAPVPNVANTLAGRLAGLTAIQQSGLPGGDKPILRIRGITTLSADFEAEPLLLVDGIERPFDQLDPNEIETISILKDASSTAVFGVRGANGVIIVTTRRGVEGKAKVSISSNFSISQPINVPDMLTSYDYALLLNEAQSNDGQGKQFQQWQIDAYRTGSNPVLYPNIKWFDYLMKDFSWQTQHNVNVSGGTKNVRYFISMGYLYQNGLWKSFQTDYNNNNTFNRYNFRSNFDIDFTETLSASINLGGRIEQRHSPNTNIDDYFAYVYTCPPNTSAGIVDGRMILHNTVLGPKREPLSNLARSGYKETLRSNVDIKLELRQSLDVITKGFLAKVGFAYDSYYSFDEVRAASIPAYYVDRGMAEIYGTNIEEPYIKYSRTGIDGPLGYATSYGKNRKMYFDASINYNRTFDSKHYVTGLLLYNQNKEWYPSNIGLSEIPRAYIGFVGRATYDFSHRYLAELNFGYNGSENFPKGKRYGFFPAYSVGWVLSEESWMKDNKILSFLKLKGSIGKVGNDKVTNNRFLYLPSAYNWVNNGNNNAWFGADPQQYPIVQEGKVGNPNVTWEEAIKKNLAFESKWLNNRFSLNFDYFKEKREKILTTRLSVPAHVAAIFYPSNIGKVNSWGYEVETGWTDKVKKISYYVKGNFSFNRNKIIEFDEVLQEESWLNKTGKRVGQYTGLKCIGIFTDPEQLTDPNLPKYDLGTTPQLGDLMYEDYNKDGVINYKDVVPIGYSRWPEISYGISAGFNYKGFNMSVLFQGTAHVSNFYSGDVRTPFRNDGSIFSYHTGRWTPENNKDASYPRLTMDMKHSNYVELGNVSSSYWLKDASYLRLKNIELGYSFSSPQLKNLIGISLIRVYCNANNVYTWSKLKIFDPESTPGGPYRYPQLRTYNMGVNIQF